MNIGDLLGSVMQSGMSGSSANRLRTGLGGGILGQLGGGQLGGILGEVERAVGGRQNLALGGLGALAGALAGGRRGVGGALRGGIGGGAMALLGLMAYQALRKSGSIANPNVPVGVTEPKSDADRAELALNAELVLKAMVNAAKADGRLDESEIGRMVGKVQEFGADRLGGDFLKTEMEKPMDTDGLVAAARGKPELAAQLYAASLLAIEVDTPAEEEYLARLAEALGLAPEVTRELRRAVGLG
jgi:uncharacterized membrane protein YebE (DUF533 family)